jgi:acetyltransferase-like isoleucine patch superfamily enzyme
MKRWLKLLLFRIRHSGKRVVFSNSCLIGIGSHFDGLNVIGKGSAVDVIMGYGSYVGSDCRISARIGKYCSIASNVVVLTATHPLERFVSTHPMFYSLLRQNGATYTNAQKFEETLYADRKGKYGVIIGNDVWIGHGATLIGGISIGDGAVVLANATVTKDVAPYSIVAGIPAQVLKKRFDDETIQFLLSYRWWDRPDSWIRQNVDLFSNIERFKHAASNAIL